MTFFTDKTKTNLLLTKKKKKPFGKGKNDLCNMITYFGMTFYWLLVFLRPKIKS